MYGIDYDEARQAIFRPTSAEDAALVRQLARLVAASCGCQPPRLLAGYAALCGALKKEGDPIPLLKSVLSHM